MNKAALIPIVIVLATEVSLFGYIHATKTIPTLPLGGVSSILGTPLFLLAGSIFVFSLALYYNMQAVPGRRPALDPNYIIRNGLFLSFIFNSILLVPYILSSNVVAGTVGLVGSISEALISIDSGVKYVVVQLLSSAITAIAAAILTSLRNQPKLR